MAIFQKISATLEREIERLLQPGDYLQSEHELSDRFQVNRHTLRRAVDELINKGLIQRQHGRGMMVTNKPVLYPLHSRPCFTENLANSGKLLHTKVLSCRLMPVMDKLRETFPDPVHQTIEIITLRTIDGQPASLICHTLNLQEHVKTLKTYQSGSLHSFLSEQFDLTLKRGQVLIQSRMPTETEARHLMLGRGIPVLRLETRNYATDNSHPKHSPQSVPVELSISVCRSDLMQYTLEPPNEP